MKKILKTTLAIIAVCAALFGAYSAFMYFRGPQVVVPIEEDTVVSDRAGLDHDIYVSETIISCICNDTKTGFDVTVGPTGWPVGSKLEWEVLLYEGTDNYYARLILHEYMLWWSWDDPYLLVKIPKKNVSGDPKNDEKFRWQMLWDITHATGRSYNYSPYVPNATIREINGHTVTFGLYWFSYGKYLVICDESAPW